jgi:Ca2+-binding RTX toxin-like protein
LDLTAINAKVSVNLSTPILTLGAVSVIFVNDIENVRLGGGNDDLRGTTGSNRLSGGGGNDTVVGAGGTDLLFGDAGNDRLVQFTGFARMYGGAGNDSFMIDYTTDAGSEMLGGAGAHDVLNLDSGFAWQINLATGKVTATDGVVPKQFGVQQIEDVLGGSSGDRITGDSQANRLRGFGGVDTLNGGGGNDTIIVDSGDINERYIGGGGFDTLDLRQVNIDGLRIYSSGSGNFSGGSFTSTGFEKVLGGAADEIFDDGASLTQIFGGAGSDSIHADSLPGGGEVFDGGKGRDYFYLGSNFTRDMVFNMATGALTGHGRATGFEEVLAGLGNDRVIGNGAGNEIDGDDGNDSLFGAGGTDRLLGQDGKDWLYGGAQNDRMEGLRGADHLFGGGGADVFAFVSAQDAGTGVRRDVIHDYQKGTDSIVIDMFDPSMADISNAAFSGTAFEVRYFRAGQDMRLQIDVDGDATSDFEVLVLNTNNLDVFLNS